MGIIKKPPIQRLFELQEKAPDQPRVHNKYHKTAPPDAIYVGRGSPWGNPFPIGNHVSRSREAVIERFRVEVLPHLDLTPLRGKHLVCFCKPKACHADLLLEAANRQEKS